MLPQITMLLKIASLTVRT